MSASVEGESERWCIVLVVVERDGSLVHVVEPTRVTVPCPQCGELSRWQHSRYERHPLARNPADQVVKPAVPRRTLPALGPEELNRLIQRAIAEGERDDVPTQTRRAAKQWAALWTLAIHTGPP
jgi:integrase